MCGHLFSSFRENLCLPVLTPLGHLHPWLRLRPPAPQPAGVAPVLGFASGLVPSLPNSNPPALHKGSMIALS